MDEQVWQDTRGSRPPLEAVVFDAGGTLVRLDFEWMSGMLSELGITASVDELRRAEIHGRRRYDSLAGRAPGNPPWVGPPALGLHPPLGSVGPTQAYFAGMYEAIGCRHPVLEEALERTYQRQVPPGILWARAVEGARSALDAVARLGLRACCVSNSDGRAEHHLETLGVRDGLEFVVDSQLVGIEKPDPRIFHLALDKLGVPAERAVYVGDIRSVDAAGAHGAGMHFVLIDPFGDYAAPDQLAVRRVEDLPALLASRFTLVPARGRTAPTAS